MKSKLSLALLAALCLGWSAHAAADINVGITVSATGNGAPLGLPQKNTTALLPAAIAGEKVNWFVLDDATDPTQASKNARKFVSDNRVDVIIGSSSPEGTRPPFIGDGRIAFAPAEDLLFGFAMILGSQALWIFWGRRGVQREPMSGPPMWERDSSSG